MQMTKRILAMLLVLMFSDSTAQLKKQGLTAMTELQL